MECAQRTCRLVFCQLITSGVTGEEEASADGAVDRPVGYFLN